jgi:nicotinamidase-related amidase
MLRIEEAVLVVIDVQEKLARAMHQRDAVVENTAKLVQGAVILGIPIIWTEQNPKGLGRTLPEIADRLSGSEPITKLSFSCCGEAAFMDRLESLEKKQVLVCGLEAHVCVYQTAAELAHRGYEVHIVADAVDSRTETNKNIGLERSKACGAALTSTETALFELLKVAEGDKFKQMLKVVK